MTVEPLVRHSFRPVVLGVVVGFAVEARTARPLGWRVAIGGGSANGARTAARRLIDEGCKGLISFGLAGGLDPSLRPGDVVVPAAVIVKGAMLATDPELSLRLGGVTSQTLLGSDVVVSSADEKRRLFGQTGAVAVDLESGAVAQEAAALGVPFAALRAICDPAERDLPPAAAVTLDPHGAIGVGRLMASIARRPGQLPGLLRLAADAVAARRSLIARVRRIARAPA